MSDEEERQRLTDEGREAGQRDEWDKEVVKSLMSTAQGRHWVERLLERCAVYGDAYLEDGDLYGALKRDGRASIGRFILDQIDIHAPATYNQMMRERRARLARAQAKAKKAEAEPVETIRQTPLEDLADQQYKTFMEGNT